MNIQRKLFIYGLLSLAVLTGCSMKTGTHPLLTPSSVEAVQQYDSFAEYQTKTAQQIAQHRRFLSTEVQQEIKMNTPFERKPTPPQIAKKGVVLVHGLGDSPWSFIDIADSLANKGWLVRTVLLPGHGTRPADLIDVDVDDWQALVARQAALMKQEVPDVYLGGFSTGANLALSYAMDDRDIKGLMLFSPAFQSETQLTRLTPLLAVFKDWLLTGDPDSSTNYVRYRIVPINGIAQYSHTSVAVLDKLEDQIFDRPVFMAMSEHDSVVNTEAVKALFLSRFTDPKNRLMWFGTTPIESHTQIEYVNSRIPELKISNLSHMGILFAPNNSYYGINGTEKICHNSSNFEDIKHCLQGKPVWFSGWGYQEEDKVHARSTFNPMFKPMMLLLERVFAE